MARIALGVNMEFVRHDDKPFEWGVNKAAELGYEYVEPMVHWGRELLSEAGYFHSVSMLEDGQPRRDRLQRGMRHHRTGGPKYPALEIAALKSKLPLAGGTVYERSISARGLQPSHLGAGRKHSC